LKPLKMSDSLAGHNAYEVICSSAGITQKYSLCLMQMSLGKATNYASIKSKCQGPLQCGDCPAMAMRRDEMEAGKPIYYEADGYEDYVKARAAQEAERLADQTKVGAVDKKSIGYIRGRFGTDAASKAKPKPKPKPKPAPRPDPTASPQAQLVEKLANKERTKIVLKPMPGEKPMAFQQRLKEARSSL